MKSISADPASFASRRWIILLTLILITSCGQQRHEIPSAETERFREMEYWKQQALEDILPAWTDHAQDSLGGFFSTLDADWQPVGDSLKYPSMIARHLFSYSLAYMLSGDEEHLRLADTIKDYLLTNAWDREYGGWFDALAPDNKPRHLGKSTFVQVYVITGLAMYYVATHDKEVLDYVNRSNNLLEGKVWDPALGGYYDDIARNWMRNSDAKSFASQLAPVSGYLMYMYMATRDEKFLRQTERISDVVLKRMIDPKTGWILESFDKDWRYLPAKGGHQEINIGHNIEVAWSLARLYRVNDRKDYLDAATVLSDSLHRYGYNANNGFWYETIGNNKPDTHSEFTYWWIQAYGNMFDLFMAGLYPEQPYAEHFDKGAAFWDQHFVDRKKGDTHFSVFEDGKVQDYRKANQYKSSYHSMEHCFLNYLYLAAWVNPEPFTLYFRIHSAIDGDVLYPLPVEKMNARITTVTIDGKKYEGEFTTAEGIRLPALENSAIAVTFATD